MKASKDSRNCKESPETSGCAGFGAAVCNGVCGKFWRQVGTVNRSCKPLYCVVNLILVSYGGGNVGADLCVSAPVARDAIESTRVLLDRPSRDSYNLKLCEDSSLPSSGVNMVSKCRGAARNERGSGDGSRSAMEFDRSDRRCVLLRECIVASRFPGPEAGRISEVAA